MPEERDYIWCFIYADGTIVPIGFGKSLARAKSLKHGYSGEVHLYKLVPIDERIFDEITTRDPQ